MTIDECIRQLRALGYQIEPDDRAGREQWWLVFSPPHFPGSGEPSFFDSDRLVLWAERYLLPKHIDDR